MSSKISLTVDKPCQQTWEEMSEVQSGRHCTHCMQTVVDFTQMTDGEITAYLRSVNRNPCGRLRQNQLDRYLQTDVQNAIRPRLQWGWTAFAATMLSLFRAEAQPVSGNASSTAVVQQLGAERPVSQLPESNHDCKISGRVVDQFGQGLTGAVVSLKGTSQAVATDTDGAFTLHVCIDNWPATLLVSFIGFVNLEQRLEKPEAEHPLILAMVPDNRPMMGEVVVVGYISTKKKALPDWKFRSFGKLKDSLQGMTLFPNTASPGAEINLKGLNIGSYQLTIVRESGATVFTSKITVETPGSSARFVLPTGLLHGVYRVVAFHQKSKKKVSAGLLVM